ncbi:MAG: ribbon-helix-helix protein, CopG family [Candidatus Bathyarchaeota archaeon]|nr:ribbon-helix-helix protein, CopG family [Candidatus Bathyarchaeum sp.]
MSKGLKLSLTIRLTKAYAETMEELINKGVYASKGEIVRDALRLLFEKYGEKIWEK